MASAPTMGYGAQLGSPPRGQFIAAGVICIVVSVLLLLGSLGMSAMSSRMSSDVSSVLNGVIVFMIILGIGGIVAGALACTGRPGWTLTVAIWLTVFALLALIGSANSGASGIFMFLVSTTGAVLGYMGFGQAKRYQEFKRMSNVHEVF